MTASSITSSIKLETGINKLLKKKYLTYWLSFTLSYSLYYIQVFSNVISDSTVLDTQQNGS